MPRGTPPNHPKSTGPENTGPERADFGHFGGPAVDSLSATTLENNEKIRPGERAENGFAGGRWRSKGNCGLTFSEP